jgi:nucleoside-diphosphate-sugar epimerase
MSKSLIFITGGTGFIGAEVIYQALEAGYRVRVSVRKSEQQTVVKERYPRYSSDIETVIIPDITKRKPFDTALDGVDYVIHLASPKPGEGVDLKDYIKPAVGGTEAILFAALKFPKIKTVVVTSSVLGIMAIDAPMVVDDELKGIFNSSPSVQPS